MDLHYKSYGEGEPVVILHGLFGMLDNWQTAGKGLADHYQVFLVDLPNHGRSPHREEFNYPLVAEDVVSFIASQSLDGAHLVGHSMGGKVAMQVALSHPDMVRKLVVVDIAPREYPPYHARILDALNALQPHEATRRSDIQDDLMEKLQDEEVVLFLLKNLSRDPDGGYRWKMNLDSLTTHYPEICAAITGPGSFDGPALFINGERSPYITQDDRREITGLFPLAEFRTIQDAGHWVHADMPDAVVRVIREFVG